MHVEFDSGEQELITQRPRAGMVSGVSISVCGYDDKLVCSSAYHLGHNFIKEHLYQKIQPHVELQHSLKDLRW